MNELHSDFVFGTHVCMVSQQATPNLTPLLDPAFKPSRVVMLVTPDMRDRAGWLEGVLRRRTQIKVERIEVADAWDMHALIDQMVNWLDQRASKSIALNVTGGTKPMAMAAQQAFAMAGLPIFYVQQARGEVQWLEPRLPAYMLDNRLRLEDYLHAHGWEVLDRPTLRPRATSLLELARELVMNIRARAQGIGRLNAYAQECVRKLPMAVRIERRDAEDALFRATVREFEHANACRLDGDTLSFPDEAARFFCNGGWLEDYVADVVQGLASSGGIQDFAAGLKVRSLDNNLSGLKGSNELDVAFLAHNRLHLIECKTRWFEADGAATEALYKLDSLTALGGLNTASMLISYRDLADGDRQRAKDLRIRTCVGSQLATLRNALSQWMSTPA